MSYTIENMSKIFLFLMCGASLFASEIHFFNGYRQDKLIRTNTFKSETDTTTIPSIELWQVGVNGKLANRCLPIFLSGYGYWGMGGNSAHLKESTANFRAAQNGRAHLKNARTRDYQAGAGYHADWRCWSFELSSGYAYSRQKIRTKSGQIDLIEDAPLYRPGFKTVTTWKGPWIGFELFHCWKQCRFSLGYEYHFAHYKAKHTIPQNAIAQLEGFANQTNSRQAYGNVVFLSGNYLLCGLVDLGLYFKYQNWHAPHGTLKTPYFAANGFRLPVKVRATGEWTSYLIGLNAGIVF